MPKTSHPPSTWREIDYRTREMIESHLRTTRNDLVILEDEHKPDKDAYVSPGGYIAWDNQSTCTCILTFGGDSPLEKGTTVVTVPPQRTVHKRIKWECDDGCYKYSIDCADECHDPTDSDLIVETTG